MLKRSLYCFRISLLFLLLVAQNAMTQEPAPMHDPLEGDSISVSGNKLAADSLTVQSDSIKSDAIDAPVYGHGKDSIRIDFRRNKLYIYGQGSVKYKDKDLEAEYIEMDADSSALYASYGLDSIGSEFGHPIFKEGETEYEIKKVWYNFRTSKMFVQDIITQQGEGFLNSRITKKMPNDELFMYDGIYTTCDKHDEPCWCFRFNKVKLRPNKNAVTGPLYMEIEGVPLPIGVPFGFLPFSKDYSSGIIMPTYDDEMARGFSLREGGYYFAFNDYADMALTGEIYTKGSWGVNARSNYRKKYKFSGNLYASYIITVTGDKDTKGHENSDYSQSKDLKLTWSHSQDQKSSPFSTFRANVDFSTSSYDRNSLTSINMGQFTNNQKSSSISFSYRHPNFPLSINSNASINQIARDTSLSITLPNISITLSQFYPFKRKEQVGSPKWYEKISMSYTGLFMNSIMNVKEYDFMKKSIVKDWRNGMKHDIPISASFNLLKYITFTSSVNYTERWYTSQILREYDTKRNILIPKDTIYGFYRVYDYGAGLSLNTKIYGMFAPWRMFGKWTEGVLIRHVMTPSVSFSSRPDFSDSNYGYYNDYSYFDPSTGDLITNDYPLFEHTIWRDPGRGQSGSLNISLDNNVEMKLGTDSAKKISIIDNLHFGAHYNFLADSMKWGEGFDASIRLKLGKTNLNLGGRFDAYMYDERGRHINVTRLKAGRGLGRFMGTSTSYSYSLNNETLKKLFKKGDKDNDSKGNESDGESLPGEEGVPDVEDMESARRTSLRATKKEDGEYDKDGFLLLNVPWNLSFAYSVSFAYDRSKFDPIKREYPYRFNQTLGISGNITPTKGWNFTFNTSYNFDQKQFAYTQCSISRQMHCWSMSASFCPVGPMQYYSFSIAVNASILKDLKYQQSSNYRDAMDWGK